MIFDKENLFCDDQALTASAASTNVIDLGVSRDIGVGTPIPIWCSVTTTFTSGGSTTLDVALQTDTAVGFGTAVTLLSFLAIPKASLVAGYELFRLDLPLGVLRYLRLNFTVNTANFTAGNLRAGLILDRQALVYPTSGLNVSGF